MKSIRARIVLLIQLQAVVVAASPGEVSPAAYDEPAGAIALGDALAAALANNPALAAFSWEARAREAKVLQAGVLPNPGLRGDVEDFGGRGARQGFRSSQSTISLSQLVELGGKRAQRIRLATAEQDLSNWDYEAKRLAVFTDVSKAFVAVLAAQERLGLTDELRRLATQSVQTVAATVKTGAVSPIEEARARVVLARAEVEHTQRATELDAARAALAATWGGSAAKFIRANGNLRTIRLPPTLDLLRSRMRDNPDLARWSTELEQRRAALSVESARRIPDVTVGLGGRHFADDGSGALVFEVSIPLPVFDRNQGNVRDAQFRIAKAAAEQQAAEVNVQAQMGQAYQALLAAFQEITALRDRIIPQAQAVSDGAADAYAKGLFRYLEVLDAQRTLFELRGQHLQALVAYHAAAADLERLTGTPLVARDAPEGKP